MKRFVCIVSVALAALLSCTKEKQITIDHPINIQMEEEGRMTEYAVCFADIIGSTLTGENFLNCLKAIDCDVLVVLADSDFEAGASAWFSSNCNEWNHFDFQTREHSGICSVITTKLSVSAGDLVLKNQTALQISLGDCTLTTAAITTADAKDYLEKTWTANPGHYWMHLLHMNGEAVDFNNNTFTDCLRAQWGESALGNPRVEYLYTSAGMWNRLSGLTLENIVGIDNPLVKFNVIVEEGKI